MTSFSSSTTLTKTIIILTLIATVVSIMAVASLVVQLYFNIENLDKEISRLNDTKSIQTTEIKELRKETEEFKEQIIILNNQIIVLKNQQN